MSLSPSTVTLSAFPSAHVWDCRVRIRPTQRIPLYFTERSPTKKRLLFNSLFALNVALKSNECECFLVSVPTSSRISPPWRNCFETAGILALWCHGDPWPGARRWVPVVAGSRVTWNYIFLYLNFLTEHFFLAAIFYLYRNANLAGFGMFVRGLSDLYYGYASLLTLWSRRG